MFLFASVRCLDFHLDFHLDPHLDADNLLDPDVNSSSRNSYLSSVFRSGSRDVAGTNLRPTEVWHAEVANFCKCIYLYGMIKNMPRKHVVKKNYELFAFKRKRQ